MGVLRVCGLLLWAGLALACSRTPPEVELRESLDAVQAAIESREPGAIREHLADDFAGPDGMDREAAVRLAQATFLRYRDIGLSFGPADVRIDGERATVRFTAVASGGSGAMLPEAARVHEVESGWRFDGEWRLVSLRWRPVSP